MSKVKRFCQFGALAISGLQIYTFHTFGKMYNCYLNYDAEGGIKTKEDFWIFNRLVHNMGIYPFTFLPSLYYGMNDIYFDKDEYVFRIITNKKFLKDVHEYYKKFGKEITNDIKE
jgi:hypothetical protein